MLKFEVLPNMLMLMETRRRDKGCMTSLIHGGKPKGPGGSREENGACHRLGRVERSGWGKVGQLGLVTVRGIRSHGAAGWPQMRTWYCTE